MERDNIVIDGQGYTLQETGSIAGIDLSRCCNVTVRNTEIKAFLIGILLERSSICSISGNNIANNRFGILLVLSSDNSIYHNNFNNNTEHVVFMTGGHYNSWNDSYPSGGNYWSDYSNADSHRGPYQNVSGSDGIVDVPCVIDENNVDHYPLVNPMFSKPLMGDINGDGTINIHDIFIVVKAFGTKLGDTYWNSIADLDDNKEVNIIDLFKVAKDFGKTA